MISNIISNQRRTPYRLESNDIINIRLNLYNNNKQFYNQNIQLEFYLNYPSGWNKVADSISTKNGSQNLNCSCLYISNISNCLGYVKATINNNSYNSNIIRFNFISKYTYNNYIYNFENILTTYENNIFTF
ncbi:MAG: hypothetical protein M0R17_02425 [Candidatus Omnitrophica bacterium]|jgi:hypothetical protein|nr:hypothetical protein [Candidatus Omnitrophota bacterium]